MDLSAGTVLAGRYRLDRKLGQGGMGEVWAAKNISVGTDVAIKTLSLSASANVELVMRFRREAYLLACIRSDHVARVLDFVSDEKYGHVLVLDLIRGESLADLLRTRCLSVEEALDVATDVARGMLVLHKANIVHRDLKPGNIILEQRIESRFRGVIVDFGLSRLMRAEVDDTTGITSHETALGTLEYMAPEQILNSRGVTPTSDIYSLGAIVYRSVMGRQLYGELTGGALAHAKLRQDPPPFRTGRSDSISQGLETIVMKALKRRSNERYQSTDEVLADLTALHRRREVEAVNAAARASSGPVSIGPSPYAQTQSMRASELPGAPHAPTNPPQTLPSQENAKPQPVRRGVPSWVLFVCVLGALIGGAVLGSVAERLRLVELESDTPARPSAARTSKPAKTTTPAATTAAPTRK
jgi:eukaryotic-like serine/threonine-protein kinase